MTRQGLGLDQGETRATRLLQPSPYSGRGSAEALALAGQSGALWREVKRLSAELQEVRRERDELREAARELVAELERTSGDWPRFCDEPRCCCLAMHDDGDQVACDEHQGILVDNDIEDLSYATTWRRLVALAREGS